MTSTSPSAHSKTLKPEAPMAKKVPHEMTIHGDTRIDNYYWLRDDSRTEPEILAHLQAEEDYAQAKLAHTKPLQEALFKELTERLKKDDNSVPIKRNGYWYQRRFEDGQEYAIQVRWADVEEGREQVLFDQNKLAQGQDYFALGDWDVSTDNSLLAYSTDTMSRRIYTIEFKSLDTGAMLPDKLEGTQGSVVWANDNKTLFYIRKDPVTLLGYQVFRHTLGTPQRDDVLVYQEDDKSFYTSIYKSMDHQYIEIFHNSTASTGVSVLPADSPEGEFKRLHPLEDNLEYSVQSLGDQFYIRTNWNAQNFKLMKANTQNIGDKSKWIDAVPHRQDTFLDDFIVFQSHLVLRERLNGQLQIRIIDLTDQSSQTVAFDDPVYMAGFSANEEISSDKIRLYYTSMTTPLSIYDVDLVTAEKELLKRDEILGDFTPSHYQSERIYVEARDGTSVPVSLVYRADRFKQDGANPLYLYAYGSYGSTRDPYFSASVLSLLDRGIIYAIAHVRGGQLLGRPWYDDGKLLNKKNTFNDFVDVTKSLGELKYADPGKIFAVGGSAGGLLMGAVVNQAPELYLGVAAHVPFVDVVTTMLDESIPLTTNEYDEWGNPNDKVYYDYMLSYSPYDQVKAQHYPHLLITTGLHDSQVQYFEPAKWVAKLRDMKTNDNQLLFHINMEAGHGGASGRFQRYHDLALEYAFYFDLLGIEE
ncbi:S9 family peptidase [Echinimonas agarilytica]|uniref:S9 family peptidase n=2 Tax=Echinimonas agarilytica TaxID=1215918 RepID=A0AA41W8S6_9GAMM|nr:S9 family peptidase [Echinimonas agarilytica]MCM2681402.1 S9 family peptidase [Echinimonas agarilytica]